MKKQVISLIFGFALLVVAGSALFSFAAPARTTQSRWEYCIVAAEQIQGKTPGLRVFLPHRKEFFQPSGAQDFSMASQVLNRLGEQGWEVVGYTEDHYKKSWTLKRSK